MSLAAHTAVSRHEEAERGATANGIAVSPDGTQIFVTGYDDDAVASFMSVAEIFSDGFESGTTGAWAP